MSAKNKGGSKSKANDVYLTDVDLACLLTEIALKREHPEWIETGGEGIEVCEPSAGEGSFLVAIKRLLPKCHVTCVELRSSCIETLGMRGADEVLIGKFERADREWPKEKKFDLFLGNPPYTHAIRHAKISLGRLKDSGKLWFLLRQAIYNGKKRNAFWEEFPPKYQTTLVQRASFTGGGSDQTEHTFFEWQLNHRWQDGWDRIRRLNWR